MASVAPSSASAPTSRPLQSRTADARSSPATAPPPRNHKRRAANLLRDYYGLSSDSASTPQSPSLADETGDSIASGPKIDLRSLLRSNSLSVLLGKESELLVQIRELDGERQSLVYNHHHELVAASDTIRNMKVKSESLDPSLDSLKSSFETMSTLASHLDVLRPSSSEAQNKPTINGVEPLRDLEPIVSLPATLSDLIECRLAAVASTSKAGLPEQDLQASRLGLAQAEHLWGTMEPVLAAWTDAGVAGVREIAAECRGLLKEGRKAIGSLAPSLTS